MPGPPMEPRLTIHYFCYTDGKLRRTFACIDDDQADLDDIRPLIAICLSALLCTPVVPNSITFWKLNEPQLAVDNVSTNAPLEDITTQVPMVGSVAPYVSRGWGPANLVVRLISPLLKGEKRTLEDADNDAVGLVKRAKIATESPSDLAQLQTFRALHRDPKENILDHRRVYDINEPPISDPSHVVDDLPPISLHYEGFGHFLDVFRGCKNVPGIGNVSYKKMRLAVDDFAERMSFIDNLSFTLMGANSSSSSSDGQVR